MAKGDLITSMPLVSVIIPVYNAEKYLSEAIESALAQTWPNIEIIVVDDGSTDSSLSIAKSYENVNVKVVSQHNSGASSARNKGLGIAKGAYIQFLDADDLLSRDKIECQAILLNTKPGKLAVCSTIHFPDGQPYEHYAPSAYEEEFIYDTDDPVEFFIRLNGGYDFRASMVQPGAWLTPIELIDRAGPWNEELSLDDDGEFFARVILSSNGIVKSSGKNYYRKHSLASANLSSQTSHKAVKSVFKAMLLKEKYINDRQKSVYAQKAIYRQFVDFQVKYYLSEPALVEIITNRLKEFPHWKYLPVLGGRTINAIAALFGWKTARKLQTMFARLKKII